MVHLDATHLELERWKDKVFLIFRLDWFYLQRDSNIGCLYVILQFECCGIDAVTGTGAANNDYHNSAWYQGAGATELPVSCCPSATSSSYTSTCSFTKSASPSGQHSKVQ